MRKGNARYPRNQTTLLILVLFATLADAIGLEGNWWSGSKADGTLGNNCVGWDGEGWNNEEGFGQVGSNTATNSHWIDDGTDGGMSFNHLLGFAY